MRITRNVVTHPALLASELVPVPGGEVREARYRPVVVVRVEMEVRFEDEAHAPPPGDRAAWVSELDAAHAARVNDVVAGLAAEMRDALGYAEEVNSGTRGVR